MDANKEYEIEITPEMIEAGAAVLRPWLDDIPSYLSERVAEEVYQAMQSCGRLKESFDKK